MTTTTRFWGRQVAALIGVMAPLSMSAQAGVLRGRVLVDSTEVPLEGATVLLPAQGLAGTTDSLGHFRIAGVARRTHDVVVRRIGFEPFTGRLLFTSGDSLVVDFLLAPAVQVLPGVSVATTLIGRKLAEFNERRRLGIGHFLDSTDIARLGGTRFTDKLRYLPGLAVTSRGGVVSTRGQSSLRQGCPVRIGLDGIFIMPFNLDELQPSDVAAVEWYAGPAQTPARFNSSRSACGVLMIWTR